MKRKTGKVDPVPKKPVQEEEELDYFTEEEDLDVPESIDGSEDEEDDPVVVSCIPTPLDLPEGIERARLVVRAPISMLLWRRAGGERLRTIVNTPVSQSPSLADG